MKKSIIIIALATLSIACGNKKSNNQDGESAELTGSISIDGSGTVFPVSEAVAEEFLAEQPNVKITVGESGTGGGFKKFGAGVIDICDASRDIKDKEIASRVNGETQKISEADILAILGKMVKQRLESARAYEEAGRLDLSERERAEIDIIEEFLPQQLSDAEVEAAITAAITETEAVSIRDMGRVMGVLKAAYTGQMDFGSVGPMIKQCLCAPSSG